jgi:hypothetical protein
MHIAPWEYRAAHLGWRHPKRITIGVPACVEFGRHARIPKVFLDHINTQTARFNIDSITPPKLCQWPNCLSAMALSCKPCCCAQDLLKQGYQGRNIVFLGDSGGGGLIPAMTIQLRREGVTLPAALGRFSPHANHRGDTQHTMIGIIPGNDCQSLSWG